MVLLIRFFSFLCFYLPSNVPYAHHQGLKGRIAEGAVITGMKRYAYAQGVYQRRTDQRMIEAPG